MMAYTFSSSKATLATSLAASHGLAAQAMGLIVAGTWTPRTWEAVTATLDAVLPIETAVEGATAVMALPTTVVAATVAVAFPTVLARPTAFALVAWVLFDSAFSVACSAFVHDS